MSDTPSTIIPSFQDGIDSLWKFQLRKENAALLEGQETQQKIIQALQADHAKLRKEVDERYSALEARMSNLEDGERKDRYAFERYDEEMAVLKAELGIVKENQERQISEPQAAGRVMEPFSRVLAADSSNVPSSGSRAETVTTATPSMHEINQTKISKTTVTSLTRGSIAKFGNTLKQNVITSELTVPMTRSRSRTRTRTTSLPEEPATVSRVHGQTPTSAPRPTVPPPVAAPVLANQTIKLPRLHQDHSSLKNYLEKANRTWMALPDLKEQKFEIDFIAQFIKGINDESKRKILVGELQQHHQSRTKKDGKVEILCRWKDVGQGMKDAGLIAVGGTMSGAEQKKRTTRNTDRTGVAGMPKELLDSDGFRGV